MGPMAPFTPWLPLISMAMGLFGMVATIFVIFLIVDGFRRRQQQKASADFQMRLLDRIGSAREFGEFVNSPEGERFLRAITPREKAGPRILRSTQIAGVSLCVGLAIVGYISSFRVAFDDGSRAILGFVGVILLAVGVGLGVSTAFAVGWARQLNVDQSNDDRGASEPSRL